MSGASILALRGRHGSDTDHMDHVCQLATTVFVQTLGIHRISARYLPLLNAAALVHDIGVPSDQAHHDERGRDIVMAEGLRGYSDVERAVIACIIRFHRGIVAPADEPIWMALPHEMQSVALGLAAIMRIADGLDYCHTQQARIVRKADEPIPCILVRENYNDVGIDIKRAKQKADLWEQLYGQSVRIQPTSKRLQTWVPPVRPRMSVERSAGKVLRDYHAQAYANTLGLGAFDGIDPRHDFRVAIRRLRRALQLYRDLWDIDAIDTLRGKLGELSNMIGAVRDAELAVEWLRDAEKGAPKSARTEMRRIRHDIERTRRTALGKLVQQIRSGELRSVMEITADWVETCDNFAETSVSDDCRLVDEIPRELAKHAKRIRAFDGTIREDDSLRLHVLRKQCRRMRYVVEAWYAALGPGRRKLAIQLKNVQDALGDIHDADVRSEHWTKEGGRKGNVWLAERCRYDRNSAWDRFETEWPKLVKLLGKKSIGKVAQHE